MNIDMGVGSASGPSCCRCCAVPGCHCGDCDCCPTLVNAK